MLKKLIYLDNLIPAPVDLSKLSDVVRNDVLKKTVYDHLVIRVNAVDPIKLVKKADYDTKI